MKKQKFRITINEIKTKKLKLQYITIPFNQYNYF